MIEHKQPVIRNGQFFSENNQALFYFPLDVTSCAAPAGMIDLAVGRIPLRRYTKFKGVEVEHSVDSALARRNKLVDETYGTTFPSWVLKIIAEIEVLIWANQNGHPWQDYASFEIERLLESDGYANFAIVQGGEWHFRASAWQAWYRLLSGPQKPAVAKYVRSGIIDREVIEKALDGDLDTDLLLAVVR